MQQLDEVKNIPDIKIENIPDELKQLQQWCMWKLVTKEGKDKPTKEPFFSPSQNAKTNDPSTFLRFDEAIRMLQGGLFNGIGFIFTKEDNYIGIDIDKCIDENGFSPIANEMVESFDSYTEYSPSGSGLHIIVKASDDFEFEARKDKETGIECYQKLRYFTFSGNVISDNHKVIEHRENEVTKLLEDLHPAVNEDYIEIPKEVIETYTSYLDDQQVLERLFSSQKQFGGTDLTFGQHNRFLYEHGHQSHDFSSDDWYFAKQLAYECNGDIEQMNRIFIGSALFRDKWDKKHYSNGETYGERTLHKAVCVKKTEIEKRKQLQQSDANTNEQTLLPRGYIVKGEALFHVTEKFVGGEMVQSEQMICRQAPYISRSFSDVETGNLFYEVAWKDNNNQQTTIVPASGIATKKELVALSNRSLAVTENNAKQLITYFDLYNMVNKCQREYLVSRIGHIKGKFIHPSIVDDVTIMPGDIGEKQLLESIHANGSTDEWLKNILEPIKSFPKALLMVLASFTSVILKDLKLDPFIIDFAGETSNGKTTLLKACASVWGTSHLMSEWNITKVAAERKATFLNNFPLILDDSRKAQERALKDFVYSFSGGRSKGRGSLSGSQQEFTWNNILISTGEASLNAYAEQMGGVAARIISIEGIPFPNVEPSFFTNLHNNMDVHYGAVGIEFINKWLKHREKLIPKFNEFVEECQKKAEGNPVVARVARNYAALIYTGNLLNTFFKTDIDPMVLYKIFDELVSENKALDKPKQLLENILQDLDANRKAIYYEFEPSVTMRALYKANTLWITPSYLKEVLGVEEKSIRAAWLKRGYTHKFENRGKEVDYKQVRAGKQKFSGIGVSDRIIAELGFDFSED